ncbi:LapA family protein [Pseudomonas sp. FP597]|uniref:LapA family protein n=1 Tax=Pseudomonas sp. FP597 TaxID=2954096 RepID=UPI0027354F2A|nr:LapA family protein [Pseudomonas sp. FP597]WLI08397.1 LapA family protein [Pseudomonas sp. FP597]
MSSLKRISALLLVLVLLLGILAFVLENQQSVSLQFLGWAAPQLPVSVFVVFALLIGMIIGPLVAWIARARRKRLV